MPMTLLACTDWVYPIYTRIYGIYPSKFLPVCTYKLVIESAMRGRRLEQTRAD